MLFRSSYYLFYGQNLALSYFDHPLAVGLWAWLGLHLEPLTGGQSVLALRLPGLLSYSAALVLLVSPGAEGRPGRFWGHEQLRPPVRMGIDVVEPLAQHRLAAAGFEVAAQQQGSGHGRPDR